MKSRLLSFALLLYCILSYGQSGASYVTIHDTRDKVNSPADFSQQLHLDFKSPFKDTPVGLFSTTITVAPWIDGSGGSNQFNISKQGLFYRESNSSYTGWEAWKKIAMSDENGDLYIGDESGIGEYGKKLYFGSSPCNFDDVYIARYNVASDETELRVDIGDDGMDKFVIGNKYWNGDSYNKYFVVSTFGRVGINCPDPLYTLEVNGTIKGTKCIAGLLENDSLYVRNYASIGSLDVDGRIRTREVLVTSTDWADFVFRKDYKLLSLDEVKSHIEQYASLPGIPTESEISANGVDLVKMNVKLLQKVEELTLYIIQQEEKMREQEQRIIKLENQK